MSFRKKAALYFICWLVIFAGLTAACRTNYGWRLIDFTEWGLPYWLKRTVNISTKETEWYCDDERIILALIVAIAPLILFHTARELFKRRFKISLMTLMIMTLTAGALLRLNLRKFDHGYFHYGWPLSIVYQGSIFGLRCLNSLLTDVAVGVYFLCLSALLSECVLKYKERLRARLKPAPATTEPPNKDGVSQ